MIAHNDRLHFCYFPFLVVLHHRYDGSSGFENIIQDAHKLPHLEDSRLGEKVSVEIPKQKTVEDMYDLPFDPCPSVSQMGWRAFQRSELVSRSEQG